MDTLVQTTGVAMSAPGLTISVARPDEAFALVVLGGAIERDAVTQVRQRLAVLLLTGVRFVVVDVSEVSSFDSQVWEVLAGARARLGTRQGWLRLIGATGARSVGTVASLADLFALYPLGQPGP